MARRIGQAEAVIAKLRKDVARLRREKQIADLAEKIKADRKAAVAELRRKAGVR